VKYVRVGSALAGILVVAAALTGCGARDTPQAEAVTVPKGAPIIIGSICSCTGAQAAAASQAAPIIKAWADSVNDAGGLNGHAIKLIVKDDGGNPAAALQAAKELVEQEKVIAIVGEVSAADEAYADYVASKGVPVVGGLPVAAPFSTNPDFFASGSGNAIGALGTFNQTAAAGGKSLGAFYCSESPVCGQFVPLGQLAGQLVGVEFTAAKIAGTAPNYTAPCVAMDKAGVDSIFVAHNAAVVPRVVDSCAKAGFSPRIVQSMSTFGPALLKDANFDGSLWSSPNAIYTDTSIPGVKAMHDALTAYAPDVLESDAFTETGAYAWAGGKLFEAASAAAGGFSPTSTSADVKRGLYALKDETLDGWAPPLNFEEGKPGFPTCYFTGEVSGGKLVASADGKATCLPSEQVTALVQALTAAG